MTTGWQNDRGLRKWQDGRTALPGMYILCSWHFFQLIDILLCFFRFLLCYYNKTGTRKTHRQVVWHNRQYEGQDSRQGRHPPWSATSHLCWKAAQGWSYPPWVQTTIDVVWAPSEFFYSLFLSNYYIYRYHDDDNGQDGDNEPPQVFYYFI